MTIGDPLPYPYDPAFAPYEDPVFFVSGSFSTPIYLATGTFLHEFPGYPSGVHFAGELIADDPVIDLDPPFPGWDPRTQSVQYENEDGVIGLIIHYGQVAICDDLELDPEDFAWLSADVILAPPGGIPMPFRPDEVEAVIRKILEQRLEAANTEIEELKHRLEKVETHSIVADPWGTSAPYPGSKSRGPLSVPWTGKLTSKPLVGAWAGDPIFGGVGGVAPSVIFSSELPKFPEGEHNDAVDAVSMSLKQMVRKAVGLAK